MGHKPRVSVIVAAYNVESYIGSAVMSALTQTVENIEIIVVDDASTDETVSVVKKFRDHRIKLLQNESNMGPSYSRNVGIIQADGEWIAILDADDWWAPNRLEVLLKVAEEEDAHIVCDDLYLIEDGEDVPWDTYLKSRERVIGPVDAITTITPAKMVADDYGFLQPIINANLLCESGVRYKEHLVFSEDYVFVLDCLIYGAKMIIYPGAYYYYRQRAGSITKTPLAGTQARHDLLLDLLTNKPYNQIPDVTDALRVRLRKVSLALQAIRVNDLYRQRQLLRAASIVINNPGLMMQFARHIKRSIVG